MIATTVSKALCFDGRRRSISTALLLCFVLVLLGPTAGQAQIDPGTHWLYQNEALVGLIMVPSRDVEACTYNEYWFLFDEYRYPSLDDAVSTTIRSDEKVDPETLQRLSQGRGHWVIVEATEDRADCR